MAKPLFKELVNQQIAVLRAVSYIVVAFVALIVGVLYFGFKTDVLLPEIMLPFATGILLNILLLGVHKTAFITYIVLIGLSFAEIVGLILVTGGISSPLILILVTLPGFAFYTSRKQGRIWFAISFLTVLILFYSTHLEIPTNNIVSANYQSLFTFLIILFATILNSTYLMLVKQDVSRAHKSFSAANEELEEKGKRMENLILLVNNSTELMCVIDIHTRTFDEVNPLFKILLGYELTELKGQPVSKVIKGDALHLIFSLKENGELMFDSSVVCRNGGEKEFSWSVTAKNGKLYTYGREIIKGKK